VYGNLPLQERYAVARLIGRVNHFEEADPPETIMLLGPGRWGTTTPSLGVPVSFAEINNVSILCEIVAMRDNLVPDVSMGTHFFSELVEMDMLYLAVFPTRPHTITWATSERAKPVAGTVPDAAALEHIVRVITSIVPEIAELRACADTLNQHAYVLEHGEAAGTCLRAISHRH
jgi:hypothetical protein